MRRVVKVKAQHDGKEVRITASINQAGYYSRNEQAKFQQRMADNIHAALRMQGYSCQAIRFDK